MNNISIILSLLIVIITVLATMTTKSKVRIVATLFIFLLLVGSIVFSIDAAARRVISDSVQSGTYTKDFGDGVKGLLTELTSNRIILAFCGAGLFIITLKNKRLG